MPVVFRRRRRQSHSRDLMRDVAGLSSLCCGLFPTTADALKGSFGETFEAGKRPGPKWREHGRSPVEQFPDILTT